MGLFGKIFTVLASLDEDKIESAAQGLAKFADGLEEAMKKSDAAIDNAIRNYEIKRTEKMLKSIEATMARLDESSMRWEGEKNENRIVIDENKLIEYKCSVPYKYDGLFPMGGDYYGAKLYGKYGVIDKDDNVIVPFEYDCLGLLVSGVIPASKDNKCGYINLNNEVVIAFDFDDALNFSEGLAPVGKIIDGRMKYGYIDITGEFVILPKYLSAEPFCKNNLARVAVYENDKDCNLGVIDKNDKTIVNCSNRTIIIEDDRILSQDYMHWEEFVCYDLNGVITGTEPETDDVIIEKDKVITYHTKELMYGYYIHTDGGDFCKIKPVFQAAADLNENGYAVVKFNGLYGIIKTESNN